MAGTAQNFWKSATFRGWNALDKELSVYLILNISFQIFSYLENSL